MTGEETETFQDIAEDLALTKTKEMDVETEPFKPLIEELGLGSSTEDCEAVLVYRESPDRQCFVCEESIPETGHALDEGEEYIIQRINEEGSPYPLTERTFHTECWNESSV